MKTRTWILIFAAAAVILAVLWLLLPKGSGDTVGIYQEGKLLQTVSLQTEQTITISGPAGENVITVQDGAIFVSSADCPDQICVKHGVLKQGGTPIICLPNRLVIRYFEQDAAVDAVAGGI